MLLETLDSTVYVFDLHVLTLIADGFQLSAVLLLLGIHGLELGLNGALLILGGAEVGKKNEVEN